MVFAFAACGSKTSAPAATQAPAQEAAPQEAAPADKTFNLTLAHNMAEDHAINVALTAWAAAVKEASGGTINIDIAFGGTLGSEADCVSQIQAGQLEMTKVSAGTLANFASEWNCVSVPYVFTSKDHLYKVMNGEIGQDLYKLTEKDGFVGLAWLESGTRCFYTAKTPIRTPDDLKGLKIRTMDSQMAIDMMNAFGGSATVMGYGDIYTGMQQGVVDGAENNITAMRDHADVTQYYCYDEHTMIPDVIVISTKVWNEMSDSQREIMTKTAADMVANYKELWAKFEEDVKAQVEGKVEYVTDVDKAAFQAAVAPLYENLKSSDPATYAFVERIQAAG
ncbi:MAG: TRAP transporter substrate-binding protein [Oscillospiraceae bacterium]|nr:TRAP transporter substrate-binding protein [Oscillospiraceae bacterium]